MTDHETDVLRVAIAAAIANGVEAARLPGLAATVDRVLVAVAEHGARALAAEHNTAALAAAAHRDAERTRALLADRARAAGELVMPTDPLA